MPLTDTAIKKLKPAEKPVKVTDERGLYLLINPTGSKLWRWKFRFDGKEKVLPLGQYPDVSLAQARDAHQLPAQLALQIVAFPQGFVDVVHANVLVCWGVA